MAKRTMWMTTLAAGALLAATPCLAAVDLLDRLVEKGILTQAERDELKKEQPRAGVGYKDNFALVSADNKFRLDIYGYGQVRYTFLDKDNDVTRKVADETDNTSDFSVARLRIGLKGHAFTEALKYGVLLNVFPGENSKVSDTVTTKGVALFDYFADYVPTQEFGIKVGQFKVPYATSWNISAAAQQFVDRTTADGNFRLDRDMGVDLHGSVLGSILSYDLAVFNGEGWNKSNRDDKHLWVARLSAEPLGKYPYHDSDNEISKKFLVLASGAIAYDDDVKSHSIKNLNDRLAALGESDVKNYNAFLGLKFQGASVHTEYYHRRIASHSKSQESARGFYVQAGYFLWKNIIEAAGRYDYFDPNMANAQDLHQEYGAAFNWFFVGHRSKVQADYFRINDELASGDSVNDDRFRVQYELQF